MHGELQKFLDVSYEQCLKVNPSNPLAVARNIEKMYLLFGRAVNRLELKFNLDGTDKDVLSQCYQVFADIKKGA